VRLRIISAQLHCTFVMPLHGVTATPAKMGRTDAACNV